MRRREALLAMATASLALPSSAAASPGQLSREVPTLSSTSFKVELDPTTGGVLAISHPADPSGMSWVTGPDNAPWHRRDAAWGLGFADLGPGLMHRGRWDKPTAVERQDASIAITYQVGDLAIRVERRLEGDTLRERYAFTNIGSAPLPLGGRERQSRMAIYAPFNDCYTSAEDVIERRAHAHVWAGGASSWVALLRMGGRAPHLGLVITEGALDGYSIEDRDEVTSSNTRGTFLLHPALGPLAPGESRAIAWTLFWHQGWEDFFKQAARHSPQMVQVRASRWTAFPGEPVELAFEGDLGSSPSLIVDNASIPLVRTSSGWSARLIAGQPKSRSAVLKHGAGLESGLSLNTAASLDDLIAARVAFITTRQQWGKAGDPWDGAYLVYDNETDAMVRNSGPGPKSDRNDARERLGMGVLVARWLRQGGRPTPEARKSLERYYRFVREQLQRTDGYVMDGAGRDRKRLYNWPWVMQLHLEMAALSSATEPLDAFMLTLESFYREGGADFYPIGLPVAESLAAMKAAGRSRDHARALTLYTGHGRSFVQRGLRYPTSEVNFEQSIVAPAAIILLELHRATGDRAWLDAARPHLALLDLMEGRQPDHHLHGVSIRHWDGYWFGKAQMWGDTFPHYWSSLNALAWHMLGQATGDVKWLNRAETTLRANLSLFTTEGRGHAAYLYPKTVNGRPGRFLDGYANDQDWALVHALQLRDMRATKG